MALSLKVLGDVVGKTGVRFQANGCRQKQRTAIHYSLTPEDSKLLARMPGN